MDQNNIPQEERTAEKFNGYMNDAYKAVSSLGYPGFSPKSKWGYASLTSVTALHGEERTNSLTPEELNAKDIDVLTLQDEMQQYEKSIAKQMHLEMINVDDMIKEMRDIDLDAIKDPKEASEKVLGTAAKILNTNLMIMTGQSLTTMGEFNKSTEKLRNSPEFKQVVLDNGGTGFGSLKGLQQKITKDCGKTLLGEFMQTSLHMKQQNESFQRVKDEYAKKKALELDRPQEEKVLGMNNNN